MTDRDTTGGQFGRLVKKLEDAMGDEELPSVLAVGQIPPEGQTADDQRRPIWCGHPLPWCPTLAECHVRRRTEAMMEPNGYESDSSDRCNDVVRHGDSFDACNQRKGHGGEWHARWSHTGIVIKRWPVLDTAEARPATKEESEAAWGTHDPSDRVSASDQHREAFQPLTDEQIAEIQAALADVRDNVLGSIWTDENQARYKRRDQLFARHGRAMLNELVNRRSASPPAASRPTAREAARRRQPLDGADAQALEHALTITERERDKAKADYRFMVERAADRTLDGYRELAARAAAAENERDELRRASRSPHVAEAAQEVVSEIVRENLPKPAVQTAIAKTPCVHGYTWLCPHGCQEKAMTEPKIEELFPDAAPVKPVAEQTSGGGEGPADTRPRSTLEQPHTTTAPARGPEEAGTSSTDSSSLARAVRYLVKYNNSYFIGFVGGQRIYGSHRPEAMRFDDRASAKASALTGDRVVALLTKGPA